MGVNEFAKKAITDFKKHVTDYAFRHVEETKELKEEYEKLSPKSINPVIGKKVKRILNLGNIGRLTKPKAKSIKSATKH